MPTYRGERFIAESLGSVLAQTYQDLEVIVGDDCSPDGTAEVARAVAAGDPRVKVVVYDRNIGSFNNTTRLYGLASGAYIKFLLQDDLLAPTAIEQMVEGLASDPRLVLATSKRALIDERGARLPDGPHTAALLDRPGTINGLALGDFVLANMLNVIGEISTALFRRDIELGHPPLSIDTREMAVNGDIALWLKLLARGDAFYTPQELCSFRQHDAQYSRSQDVAVNGLAEWPLIVDRARSLGFLADPKQERSAHQRILRAALDLLPGLAGRPEELRVLEVLYVTTARLAEIADGRDAPGGFLRLHDAATRERFAVPLDGHLPVPRHRPGIAEAAVAVPAATTGEVARAVEGLRALAIEGAARRFIALVPPDQLEDAEPRFAAALAAGRDFDLELVPSADVAAIRQPGWILVA